MEIKWKWDWNTVKNVLLIILAIVCMILIWVSVARGNKNRIYGNNITALQDSVRVIQRENGELLAAKHSLIIENANLDKDTKKLQKELDAKIEYIANMKTKVRIDSVVVHDTVTRRGDTIVAPIRYADDWFAISGEQEIIGNDACMTLDSAAMNVPLTVGLTDDYQIFVKTANPYVSFPSIDGAYLKAPEKVKSKHWNIGVQAGFGVQYGTIKKSFDVGPYIGVGVSYGWCF